MAKLPTYEEMVKKMAEMAEEALDGYIYKGKTLREWVDIIAQKEKTGAWVPTDEEPHEDYECNKCGYAISTFTANIEPHTEYKYCPNCGARMFEPQESKEDEEWEN